MDKLLEKWTPNQQANNALEIALHCQCPFSELIYIYQQKHTKLSRPDLRDPFYVSIWFGQGVIWGGYSMFYYLYFYVLAG